MGKKMKLPFLSKNTSEISRSSSSSSSSWPWPSCTQTRTISFRTGNDIFKTINSAYFDTTNPTTDLALVDSTPDSVFTNSSSHECPSFTTASKDSRGGGGAGGGDAIESLIKGLRSERLFFEPAGQTSSVLVETKEAEAGAAAAATADEGGDGVNNVIPFKESVALSIDSPDPIVDFRKSMEEMVEAHGLKDWENLEELLCWYLRVNGKSNHGYIVGAFVDLLVGLAFTTTSSNSCSCIINSPSSPFSNFYNSITTSSSSSLSSSSSSATTPCVSSVEEESESTATTPCLSSLLEGEEDQIKEEENDDGGGDGVSS
ncbi:transcription repressor OFP13-like [Pyrus ussuriensis x Pyrus communis]|uniref:Transcription repressor n=1 Tax=Pyrus ussuriensis x Pyrus communis TaxID=2448454 RepID=A0A5N5HQA0_9ROSA|nr:transcription repressor OFP13-like [Pyrus ussuriensis x Pyrus communis]